MKELKRLRVKFVLSNMVMVTLVIGLAFLGVGYFTKNQIDRDNEKMLGMAVEAEHAGSFLEWEGIARMPYFIVVTDGNNQIIQVEDRYGMGPDTELVKYLAAQSLSAPEAVGTLENYQLRYLRIPVGSGYRIAYGDTSLGETYLQGMWKTLAVVVSIVWVALFLISCILSKWAVYPLSLSMRREKQFVADASHELKTPLTVIMANAQLLEDQDTNRTGDGKRWLTNIRQEAEEMKALVEEMLALARSEAERENIVLTECCFSDVVIESVLSFEAVFYQENKELRSDVEEGISLQGNEKQLKQLLKILLDNAEKYSPEGGRAVVQLKRVNGRKARLTVSNTGEAISREKQQEIFERFYRADLSRSDRKGYGLGLAIAKNIVELHRGKIRVESSEGENRFIVELRCV